MSQLGPKAARMLSGLLYAKYRQLLKAKCFRAGVELILIDPAYTSTIGAVKYAARRGWSVHAAAAGVIARRGQKLTEYLPRADTVIRVPVRGGHHALELPARKSRDSRVAAWRSVHAAYRGVVHEQWLATRCAKPHRCERGTTGDGGNAIPLSRDYRYPCDNNLHMQVFCTIRLTVISIRDLAAGCYAELDNCVSESLRSQMSLPGRTRKHN